MDERFRAWRERLELSAEKVVTRLRARLGEADTPSPSSLRRYENGYEAAPASLWPAYAEVLLEEARTQATDRTDLIDEISAFRCAGPPVSATR